MDNGNWTDEVAELVSRLEAIENGNANIASL